MEKKICEECNNEYDVEGYRFNKSKFCSYECYWKNKKGKKWEEVFNQEECDRRRKRLLKRGKEHHNYGKKRPDTTLRNLLDNPMKRIEAQEKLSQTNTITGYWIGRNKGLRYLPARCINCKETDIKKLHVHHVDKDRTNNQLDNLQILCRSCHMKLHKGKKKR